MGSSSAADSIDLALGDKNGKTEVIPASKKDAGSIKKRPSSHINEDSIVSRKTPKRAAACANFKEKSVRASKKDALIETKKHETLEDEELAVSRTAGQEEDGRPCRRLTDFTFHNSNGVAQPFEMSEVDDIFISGSILPLEDSGEKERDKGVRCENFGRVEEWAISGYEDGSPVIWISTNISDYDVLKPAGRYKKLYDHFYAKATACIEVYKKLSKSSGGNPDVTLKELLAGVARAMSGMECFPGGQLIRKFVVSQGEFIYKQLIGLDGTSKSEQLFVESSVLAALRDKSQAQSVSSIDLALGDKNGKKEVIPASKKDAGSIKKRPSSQINEDSIVSRKTPKRAAACANFKEKSVRASKKDALIETKKHENLEDEELAVSRTAGQEEDGRPCRRLTDFTFHNSNGVAQPFEMSEVDDIFISGSILPLEDSGEKERDKGVRCENFGRVEEWAISGYEDGSPVIWISTNISDYDVLKPAGRYKKLYDHFYAKATACIEVYKKLSKSSGGNPDVTLKELLAGVARAMSGMECFPGGQLIRKFVVSQGEFIYKQLIGLDGTSKSEQLFVESSVLAALRDKSQAQSVSSIDLALGDKNGKKEVIPASKKDAGSIKKRPSSQINEDSIVSRKTPKRAAACANFKEKSVRASKKDALIETKKHENLEDEELAVSRTAGQEEDGRPCRRLTDFTFHNSNGVAQPFEMSEVDDIFISGSILPLEDSGEKERDKGVRCENFGRVEEWAISGYEDGSPVIWISTNISDYDVLKPAGRYKKLYDHFYAKATACIEVYKKLSKSSGGNPDVTLKELLAGVARAMSGMECFPGGQLIRKFVVSQGEFIYKQLIGLDGTSKSEQLFVESSVLAALRDKSQAQSVSSIDLALGDKNGKKEVIPASKKDAGSIKKRPSSQINEDSIVSRKTPKRAAACANFKEKSVRASKKDALIETKKHETLEDEELAVSRTAGQEEDGRPCRRLTDFTFHNSNGVAQPFEMSEVDDIFISGSILPLEDSGEKERDKGVRCENFGRVEEWAISGYEDGSPVIWISTNISDYDVLKPAGRYKKLYDHFYAKATACIEVYKKLSKSSGGNPDVTLKELLAGVARAMSGMECFPGGQLIRKFVVSQGEFIYKQLIGLDGTSKSEQLFVESSVLAALRDKSQAQSVSSIDLAQMTMEDEELAVRRTAGQEDDGRPCRRLTDFTFHNSNGVAQPFEMSEVDDIFISGSILPLEDSGEKERDKGVRCENFGRVEEWAISGYEDGSPVIWISTNISDYDVLKPAGRYKKLYDHFYAKATACIEVYKKLSKSSGGNPDVTLKELIASVVRATSLMKCFPGGQLTRKFVVSQGEFIYKQLIGLDGTSKSEQLFVESSVLAALRDKSQAQSVSSIDLAQMTMEDEELAVRRTAGQEDDGRPCRRLTDFTFHNSNGVAQPFEMSEVDDIFISGSILPLEDSGEKERDKGVRCENFGRVEEWAISGYEDGSPVIWISTNISDYDVLKPAGRYKKLYDHFYAKATACIEVYKKLSKSSGGNPDVTLKELLAGVARAMSGMECFPGGQLIRKFVVSQGEFIYKQLIGLDGTSKSEQLFVESSVLAALRDKSQAQSVSSIDLAQMTMEDEELAVRRTAGQEDDGRPCRRLTDFTFHNSNGVAQPFEMSEVDDIFISGSILPLEDSGEKERDKGVRCENFGRVEEWAISGYEDGSPVIWISTNISDYDVLKPAGRYKKLYDHFYAKATACIEVYKKLSKSSGGNPDVTLKELIASVVRATSLMKCFPGGQLTRKFVVSQGEFIYKQLIGLDGTSKSEQLFVESSVLAALRDESQAQSVSSIDLAQMTMEDEELAVRRTAGQEDDGRPCRRLTDFTFHNSNGVAQPFEMSEVDDIFISGSILPLEDSGEKERDKGVRCENFGRVEEWAISGYEDGSPVIWISTNISDYDVLKPAGRYKKLYDHFYAKATACIEVYKKLSKSSGGNPDVTLKELIASVVRATSLMKCFPGGQLTRKFVVSQGEFIYKQLIGLDGTSKSEQLFVESSVLAALRDESSKLSQAQSVSSTKGVRISPDNAKEKSQKMSSTSSPGEAVENPKIARLLQEEKGWRSMKRKNSKKSKVSSSTSSIYYIKINEDEIANDYPLPAYYKLSNEETDEFIIFDSGADEYNIDDLPRSMLHDWTLYNEDARLVPLELLPLKPCAEIDVTIFGSGVMTEDDGSGYCFDGDSAHSSSVSGASEVEGMTVFLSAIKEWVIEFGSSMVSISIRTDMAWYRLGKPSKQYAPWYEQVLKIARLAISMITLLKEQSRVARLSFDDVIKKASEFRKDHPAFISSNPQALERYVAVHGQLILQQFSEYPDDSIKKSAFLSGLIRKMEERHHTKWVVKSKNRLQRNGLNLNPRAAIGPVVSKQKAMQATATRLINRIWGEYYSNYLPEESSEGIFSEAKEDNDVEEPEDNEDDDAPDEETKVPEKIQVPSSVQRQNNSCSRSDEVVEWNGDSVGKLLTGETLYGIAIANGNDIAIRGAVLAQDGLYDSATIYFVEYMFEKLDGSKCFHGRIMRPSSQTVLGNAGNDREIFLTNECMDVQLGDIKQSLSLDLRSVPWGHQHRKAHADAEKADRARAEERKKKGLRMEYYCKCLYSPERGAFFSLPIGSLGLGSGSCQGCKSKEADGDREKFTVDASTKTFIYKGMKYYVHDYVYVSPYYFSDQRACKIFKGGRNVGLKPYVVCEVLEICDLKQSNRATPRSVEVKVRRFFRPEDVSVQKAYSSDIRELYYSEETHTIPVDVIEGKCEIRKKKDLGPQDVPSIFDHVFFCKNFFDPSNGSVKQLPSHINLRYSAGQLDDDAVSRKNKGKSKEGETDLGFGDQEAASQQNQLATLDIFAGCGGLSTGLHQSGVASIKWAIEYENPAGEAFKLNHPGSTVFVNNCNVILRAVMQKCGDADDCISTPEAAELAAELKQEEIDKLPMPGQVEFINGGPPCQGFSGMNRFNQSTWSKVQCEMILAFLSFAEYYRPKFFLLENVRNFVSFNQGKTFRLTLASLLEMGYQVRFGVLEAGAYGIPQARKRAFVWAASPDELLPEWPEPMHVFAAPMLKISLSGNAQYSAVRSTARGAPFRSLTVRDSIADLPPVNNGASNTTLEYKSEPVSWYQKRIRGNMATLTDHISKEMSELNLIRCQRIPKRPGADWRDLPEEKVMLSNGQTVDLIPWFLPNTAKRHNQWKGLFGRLYWEGNFPTSITDPQPMGKVGMCFHPVQDRIVTVRECARSQGFPDNYQFYGNVLHKHRQIGNAVPPPLAYALGKKLKEAVDRKIRGC